MTVSQEDLNLFTAVTRELHAYSTLHSFYSNEDSPKLAHIRDAFTWLTDVLPGECDVWIGCAESGLITENILLNIINLWDSRHNLEKLASPMEPVRVFVYRKSLFTPIKVFSKDYARLMYASFLIDCEKYEEAASIIIPIIKIHPKLCEARKLAATLAFATHRWNDLVEHTHILQSIQQDDSKIFCFTALQKLAHIHLGHVVDVKETLHTLDTGLLTVKNSVVKTGDMFSLTKTLHSLSHRMLHPQKNNYTMSAPAPVALDPHVSPTVKKYETWIHDCLSNDSNNLVDCNSVITSCERIMARTSFYDYTSEPTVNPSSENEINRNRENIFAEADMELENFYGLESVKQQVRHLRNIIVTNQLRKDRGLPVAKKTQHLIFEGPPGTGKTTIARVIAKIYYGLHVTDKDTITEVTRAEIVGQHIGETESKVNALVDKALGGVLFIDEAYALVATGAKNDFGLVAINTLLTRMENERDKLIVIIAGYPEDLLMLLEANEGLRSRFKEKISFNSYTPAELVGMAKLVSAPRGTILSSDALRFLEQTCITLENVTINDNSGSKVKRRAIDVAGNARFIRNILECAENTRDSRLGANPNVFDQTDEQLQTITQDDMVAAVTSVLNILRITITVD